MFAFPRRTDCGWTAGWRVCAFAVVLLLAAPAPAVAQAADPAVADATRQLFEAVEVNDLVRAKASLKAGADLQAKNADGMTAADLAVDKGHFIIAHYLLSERVARRKAAAVGPRKPVRLTPEAVEEALKQAPPKKPKPRPTAKSQFGAPPAKPAAPLKPAEEISVAAPPGGVSREPAAEPMADLTPPVTPAEPPSAAAETAEPPAPKAEPPKPPPPEGKLANVGRFFRTLVDIVMPGKRRRQPAETATAEPPAAPEPAPAAVEAAAEPSAEQDQVSETVEETVPEVVFTPDQIIPPPSRRPSVAEQMAEAEAAPVPTPGEPGLETIEEAVPEVVIPPEEIIPPKEPSTTTSRTADRLSDFMRDKPLEDEFGLPIVEEPDVPAPGRRAEAMPMEPEPEAPAAAPEGLETFIEETVDEQPPVAGETEAAAEATIEAEAAPDIAEQPSPVRKQLQIPADGDLALPKPRTTAERLRMMTEALNREIKIDPEAVLEEGRRRGAERLAAEEARTDRLKRPPTDVGKDIRAKQKLRQRTDPAKRFLERMPSRVERLRRQEYKREDDHGLPDAAPDAAEPKDLSAVERMALFFTGAKDKRRQERPGHLPQREIGADYRDAGESKLGLDAEADKKARPEVEIRKQFEADVKETGQKPGRLTSGFLDKLARFFDEDEEKAALRGWMAQIEVMDPGNAPDKYGKRPDGTEVPAAAAAEALPEPAEPWTTTVEKSVGEGEEPVVVQVTETPVEAAETALPAEPGAAEETVAESLEAVEETVAEAPAEAAPETPAARVAQVYRDPLRPPDPDLGKDETEQFFGRLTQLFQPPPRQDQPTDSLLLEPEEVLATSRHAQPVAGRRVEDERRTEPPTLWPITEVAKSESPPPVTGPRPGVLSQTLLSDVSFSLGESVTLESALPPGENGSDPQNECVKKNRGTTLFCIEPVDWPDELRATFTVPTILYTGNMAIVRYDQGEPSRLHALFPSEAYQTVTDYYEGRYGEPTEIWKRSIAPLAEPRRDNPTVAWRSRDPDTNAITVLEVRQFDDSRGGFPDTKRGAVMLYVENSPAIFPQVSSHELMRLKREQPTSTTAAVEPGDEGTGMPGMEPIEGLEGVEGLEAPTDEAPIEGLETPMPQGSSPG